MVGNTYYYCTGHALNLGLLKQIRGSSKINKQIPETKQSPDNQPSFLCLLSVQLILGALCRLSCWMFVEFQICFSILLVYKNIPLMCILSLGLLRKQMFIMERRVFL